jgi:hypothetical protein
MTFARIAIVAVALFTAAGTASAQLITVTAGEFTKVGLAGGQFLRIQSGARGTGMAGAFAGVVDDLSSMYWNAAGLAETKGYGAEFNTTFWFAGMQHNYAAVAIPMGEKFKLGASFIGFGSGDIQITSITDPNADAGGIYQVQDMAIGLTFAGKLTDAFSFGVTGRYVNMAFTQMNAGAFIFDVGTRYTTGYRGIVLGFAVNNLGGETRYDGSNVTVAGTPYPGTGNSQIDMNMLTSEFTLPLIFRAGLGVDMLNGMISDRPDVEEDGTITHKWIMAADFETFSDVPEQFSFGTEYTFREFVTARLGYRIGTDEFGLCAGVGLNYESSDFAGAVDWSITPTQNIGLVNRLGLRMKFN